MISLSISRQLSQNCHYPLKTIFHTTEAVKGNTDMPQNACTVLIAIWKNKQQQKIVTLCHFNVNGSREADRSPVSAQRTDPENSSGNKLPTGLWAVSSKLFNRD